MDSNPWLHIPLEDYERHMSHHLVGQSTLLNALTKKYLDAIKPEVVIFFGIAGGNGLEHIDNQITQSVYGIDINQDYLDTAYKRYKESIPHSAIGEPGYNPTFRKYLQGGSYLGGPCIGIHGN